MLVEVVDLIINALTLIVLATGINVMCTRSVKPINQESMVESDIRSQRSIKSRNHMEESVSINKS